MQRVALSLAVALSLLPAFDPTQLTADEPLGKRGGSGQAVVKMIQLGEVMIETHIRGVGPAVVLLPGTGGDVSQFAEFAPILSTAGFQTIALSVRGAGGSTGPLEGLTLHDYAADVAGVIKDLKVAPAHVLGRTGGNRVARCLAVDQPELVKSIILVAAGGLIPGDPKAIAAMDAWAQATVPEPERLTAFRSSMLSPATNPERVKPFAAWPAANRAQNAAEAATPRSEWWTAGRAPLLVIQGLDDVIAPPGNGRALREQLGERVKVVDIPKAGHALLLEQPDKIATEVITFLRTFH